MIYPPFTIFKIYKVVEVNVPLCLVATGRPLLRNNYFAKGRRVQICTAQDMWWSGTVRELEMTADSTVFVTRRSIYLAVPQYDRRLN